MTSLSKVAYTVPEFAEALGVSKTHVWNAIRRNEINTFTLGRRRLISSAELQRIMGEAQQN